MEDNLFSALAKFQGLMRAIPKDKTVDFQAGGKRIKYSYSDLATIIETIRKPLAECGIAHSQTMEHVEGKDRLVTTLYHRSGERIQSTMSMPMWADMKTLGSHITYLRRYALSAILGLCSDDDIDALTDFEEKPAAPNAEIVKPQQVRELTDLLATCSKEYQASVMSTLENVFGIKSLNELTMPMYIRIRNAAMKERGSVHV